MRSTPRRRHAVLHCLGGLLASGLFAGCFAAQNRPPAAPVPAELSVTSPPRRAVLTELRITGIREADRPQPQLARALADYLEASTPFERVAVALSGERGAMPYEIRAALTVQRTNNSTLVLDLMTLGVVSPWWGDVYGKIELTVLNTRGHPLARVAHTEQVNFSQLLFSWLGQHFVEGAYQTLYALLFQAAAETLDAHWGSLTADAPEEPVPIFTLDHRQRLDPIERAWDDTRVRILTEAPRPDPRIPLWLRGLGGIEAQRFRGLATISSGVVDELGNREVIASGNAEQRGYRIALFTPPKRSGFSLYPVAGYFDQSISIEDFREEVVVQESDDPNAIELGARCRDLNAGVPVDCDIPNAYDLDLRSFYLGARAGFDLVFGTVGVRNALSVNAGVNAVEYRDIDVSIGDFRARDGRWSAFRSVAVGLQGMIFLPEAHVGIRGVIDYERYLRFGYPQGLQFKGPSRFDPELGRNVRPRLTVEDGALSSISFQIATFIAF